MVDFPVVLEKLALLNVDMQNCFVENSPVAAPGGRAVLDKINKLIGVCREAGIQIIHAEHVLRPDGSNMGVLGEIVPSARDGLINKDSETAQLHPDLAVADDDIVLDKPRFGAFHGTDLELILRSKGIDSVIVTGIATNVCCDTTARQANMADFRVFFLSDGNATFGIGDVTAAEIQRVTLATMGALFGQVLSVDEMIDKIRTAGARSNAA